MPTTTVNPQTTSQTSGNGSTPLIRLNAVTKVFLTDEVETHALSGIHLDIRNGEYISIAGPSGCGKSTLLSILGLLDTPSDGSYALKGHEVANLSFADRARMGHRAKHLPSQLPGGQQQRVAVARALAGNPAILLADEPTGNLDSRNGEAVMNLLKELHAAGATICMVTHDPRFAQNADRTVHLFDGRVVEDSVPAQPAPPMASLRGE